VHDPKEVFVSSYFFTGALLPGSRMVPVDEWHTMFLGDWFPHGSKAKNFASYWPWRTRRNVLLLNYGDMTRDLEGTVRRIAAFMNIALTDAEVALVLQKRLHIHEADRPQVRSRTAVSHESHGRTDDDP
jgi:hypothetical protein